MVAESNFQKGSSPPLSLRLTHRTKNQIDLKLFFPKFLVESWLDTSCLKCNYTVINNFPPLFSVSTIPLPCGQWKFPPFIRLDSLALRKKKNCAHGIIVCREPNPRRFPSHRHKSWGQGCRTEPVAGCRPSTSLGCPCRGSGNTPGGVTARSTRTTLGGLRSRSSLWDQTQPSVSTNTLPQGEAGEGLSQAALKVLAE